MIADDTEGLPITKGNNVSLCVTFENVEDTKRIYDKFVELGSEILLPLLRNFTRKVTDMLKMNSELLIISLPKEKLKRAYIICSF